MDTFAAGLIIGFVCVAAVVFGGICTGYFFHRKHWLGVCVSVAVWLVGAIGVTVATLLITGA